MMQIHQLTPFPVQSRRQTMLNTIQTPNDNASVFQPDISRPFQVQSGPAVSFISCLEPQLQLPKLIRCKTHPRQKEHSNSLDQIQCATVSHDPLSVTEQHNLLLFLIIVLITPIILATATLLFLLLFLISFLVGRNLGIITAPPPKVQHVLVFRLEV